MSNGSGLFSNQAATLQHLLLAGGLSREIADVRNDVSVTLAPLVGVAIEEYDYPSVALPSAIMLPVATVLTAHTYQGPALNGAIGSGAISPPRNITGTKGGTVAHAPATMKVVGQDAMGNTLVETITLGTPGSKCFARVSYVTTPAATGTDATIEIGTGLIIGLSNMPKLRAGQTTPLIRREIVDGSVVTNGTLSTTTTNPPFGAYTPNASVAAQAPASSVGNVDVTAAALYGNGGTLDGTKLVLTVNGVGPTTLTFNKATNAASETAMLAAITTLWPSLTTAVAATTGFLTLATVLKDQAAVLVVGTGAPSDAAAILGLTAATTHGGGHLYCIEYELDGTVTPSASIQPATVPAIQPPPQP